MLLAAAPEAVRRAGMELLLVDQVEIAGACVADRLRLPFITVSCALVANREPAIPPIFTGWSYSASALAALRNRLAYRFQERLTKAWMEVFNRQRQEWHLPRYRVFEDSTSPWAHLSQQPACFDFPRRRLPGQFHYTGPWQDRRVRQPVPFPYDKLTGKPLIYASMGTLQNRIRRVFWEIARACEGLDAQLVVSLGGGSTPEEIGPLPGNPLAVGYAPQLELLTRAALTITHAGLNTTLESLSYGVPIVALPVGNDQPGVAARVKWLGAGQVMPLKRLSADRLRPLVSQVLNEDGYRQRARQLREEIQKTDGVRLAAGVIERVLTGQRPVLRATATAAQTGQ
jgi:zeaxanthin glucosyltransferase